MQKRDFAIDVLKFIAALLITNSHMDILYGEYSFLSTGGTLGDHLFFFCSGYTLFISKKRNFLNWYKRRINRIYPTIFSWMLICCIVWGWSFNLLEVILKGGGWFIECIMIYYIIFWFIQRFFIKYLYVVFILSFVIVFLVYFMTFKQTEHINIFGATTFKYWYFFLSMLSGAIWGVKQKIITNNYIINIITCIISIIVFYMLSYTNTFYEFGFLQLFTIFPLISFSISLYKLCYSPFATNFYNNKVIFFITRFIGGLCLEIYLVQYNLFTDKLNNIFPLNIPIMFVIIVIAAYTLKCFSNLWKQTFSDSDYNWRNIIKVY